MTFVIRSAGEADLQSLYEMAKRTGGGFTNLPPDKPSLAAKLATSAEAFARDDDVLAPDLFVFVLENRATGEVRGTCQIFSQVGQKWPFYSYRMGVLTQHSVELDRTFRAEMLNLSTDLEGASEVGGLFLHPGERAGGLGLLIARSRYLFIGAHRPRFGERCIAELRGVIDEAGGSPFWDGVAGKFFGMSFQDADEFNAKHGNQFIADLMPKYPIYTALLPASARAVMGKPHDSGIPALRMLEREGFASEGYIDIFDGGPTVWTMIDHVRTVHECRTLEVSDLGAPAGEGRAALLAKGELTGFRAWQSDAIAHDGSVSISDTEARLHMIGIGDKISHVTA